MKRDQLIVALDLPNIREAKKIVKALDKEVVLYKVGMRLFTQEGPAFVQWLKKKKKKVFLDLKFHDIPNTVAQAVESATSLGVDLLTVHASGGPEMLQAAVQAAKSASKKLKKKPPQIFAVTVLTSMNDLSFMGLSENVAEQVQHLAQLAALCQVDGVVCSPEEISLLKNRFKNLKVLSPGIRLDQSSKDDQKRVASPFAAIQAGADYIVVGRPVLLAAKPRQVVKEIFKQARSGD